MLVKSKSVLTGVMNEMNLDITNEQLARWKDGYGEPVQDVFPTLTAEEREFLMTGATPLEWTEFEAWVDDEATE